MTDNKELDDINKVANEGFQRLKKSEEEALKNVLKHFDRLNDKLFTLNNILIAGYFALLKSTRMALMY